MSTLNPSEINKKKEEEFFKNYELYNIFGSSDKKIFIGKKQSRVCRFCKRGEDQADFSNNAHIIPEFMGNKKVFSYFECNNCNDKFSLYEDSFAKFLGAARTISFLPGKRSIPKYKNPKTGFEMRPQNGSIDIKVIGDSDEVSINEDKKKLYLKTIKQPYIPIHIPKVLVKIGLSLLKGNEVHLYENARIFLETSDNDKLNIKNDFLLVFGYFISGPPVYREPVARLYKKKDINSRIPEMQIIVSFSNYVYQMVLPFGAGDNWLAGQKVENPIFPLLIAKNHPDIKYKDFILDFRDCEKVYNHESKLTINYERKE
jgi:hypothetical protein